ncbi:MAG: BACON domain-containing protein [Chitinophagaceae bacterium]|nr:BACON domain-containing protein [Chitinophagaceae bacterium]
MKNVQLLNLQPRSSLLIIAILLIATSCKKDKVKEFTVDKTSFTTGTDASEQVISVNSNLEWSLVMPDDGTNWVTADKTKGAGNTSVKLSVKQNAGLDARSATITLKSEGENDIIITVAQKGLVDWYKGVFNFRSAKILEAADGYVIAGEKQEKIYLCKVSKSSLAIINERVINVPGYVGGYAVDLESITEGGFILAAVVNEVANGTKSDTYIAHISSDLEVLKEKVVDKGSSRDVPGAICPSGTGYAFAGRTDYYSFVTYFDANLYERIDRYINLGNEYIHDLKTAPNGNIVGVGYMMGAKEYLVRFSPTLQMERAYISLQEGYINSLVINPDNSLVVGGESPGANGRFDIFCKKFDADLNPVMDQAFILPHTGDDFNYSVIALKGGGYALSGFGAGNGDMIGYTTRLTNRLESIPGKEIWFPVNLYSVQAAISLEDGGYLVIGSGIESPGTQTFLVKINP